MYKHYPYYLVSTPDRIANAAVSYISRYAATEGSIRRVLERKIRISAHFNKEFGRDLEAQEKAKKSIDTVIAFLHRLGVLNDEAYAEMKVHSLRRSGRSTKAIIQRLKQRGLTFDQIEAALQLDFPGIGESEDAELYAARRYVKRRCLGPFRIMRGRPPLDAKAEKERHLKEITSLARAGFPFDIAKKALESPIDIEEVT